MTFNFTIQEPQLQTQNANETEQYPIISAIYGSWGGGVIDRWMSYSGHQVQTDSIMLYHTPIQKPKSHKQAIGREEAAECPQNSIFENAKAI